MSPEEAENIGAEFLAPVEDEAAVIKPKTLQGKPSAPKKGAPESEPATAGEEKVEDEAAVKPRGEKGKNKK